MRRKRYSRKKWVRMASCIGKRRRKQKSGNM